MRPQQQQPTATPQPSAQAFCQGKAGAADEQRAREIACSFTPIPSGFTTFVVQPATRAFGTRSQAPARALDVFGIPSELQASDEGFSNFPARKKTDRKKEKNH
jgi:hypothetical protein